MSLALPGLSEAKSLYVSDYRELMVRTGPSLENRIVARLRTGNEVMLLGTDGDFHHIKLPNGTEGYVPKNYLTDRVPASHRLKALDEQINRQARQLAQLRQDNDALQESATAAGGEAASQTNLFQRLQLENAELKGRRDVSWFLSGAGVLLVGWLLGWTRVRLRRKASRQALSLRG